MRFGAIGASSRVALVLTVRGVVRRAWFWSCAVRLVLVVRRGWFWWCSGARLRGGAWFLVAQPCAVVRRSLVLVVQRCAVV